MRHRKFTFKIGRTASHRRAMLANAVCSLLWEERIRTTVAKAKQIRRIAEKMITLGKRGTLHARRRAIAFLQDREVVAHLFSEIAPRYEERAGGYTRIMRLGPRLGDAAEMCVLELIVETPSGEAAGEDESGEAESEGEAESAEEPEETEQSDEDEEDE